MKLNERVAIIREENISKLIHLYGEINIDDLSRIVNSHLEVVIDEIEEDCSKKKAQNCSECQSDLIKMQSDIHITDKDGNPIKDKVPELEYMPEIFSSYHVHEKPILTEKYKKMYDAFVNQING